MSNSYKKIKHNNDKTTISIAGNVEMITANVVSLIIRNNDIIKNISKLDSLTYLKLINTNIESITQCNWLTTALIQDNHSLKYLSFLNRLDDLQCINCTQLERIDLRKNTELIIDSCNELHMIAAPKCKIVILKRCKSLDTLDLGINLIKLILCDIDTMAELELPIHIQMEHLEILNCPSLRIANIPFQSQTVIIRNCPSINQLGNTLTADNIHIDMCDNLCTISNIHTNKCTISRCPNLRNIESVHINDLDINYCICISELYTREIHKVHISQCNSFKCIHIADETNTIVLKDCISLDHIRTNMLPIGSIRDQNITLIGQFALEEINHLFASDLTIINNNHIYNIDTLHDLKSLKLINCSQLEIIANSVISESFIVHNCRYLHTISDIIAPLNISLVNLPRLTTSRFIFTPVQTLCIENCEQLTSTFIGTWMTSITLINTNIIIVKAINPVILDYTYILSSKYLPDITSDDNKLNAIQLQLYLNRRNNATMTIIRAIRKYQIRFLSNRLSNALEIQTCVICLLDIEQPQRFVSRCFHTFHIECISTWTQIRNTCPLCNALNIY